MLLLTSHEWWDNFRSCWRIEVAFTTIYLEHPESGEIEKAPIGFSWTLLLFSFFLPLFRKDFGKFFELFFIIIIFSVLDVVALRELGFRMSSIIVDIILIVIFLFYGFKYNRMFLRKLISKGFLVMSSPGFSIKELEEKLEMKLPTTTK